MLSLGITSPASSRSSVGHVVGFRFSVSKSVGRVLRHVIARAVGRCRFGQLHEFLSISELGRRLRRKGSAQGDRSEGGRHRETMRSTVGTNELTSVAGSRDGHSSLVWSVVVSGRRRSLFVSIVVSLVLVHGMVISLVLVHSRVCAVLVTETSTSTKTSSVVSSLHHVV